jgi:hypothetical protein
MMNTQNRLDGIEAAPVALFDHAARDHCFANGRELWMPVFVMGFGDAAH